MINQSTTNNRQLTIEKNFPLFFGRKLVFVSYKLKKGMSLMELVIYLAIVAIVLVVIIDLVTHLVYTQGKNSKNVEVQQNTNFIIDRLSSSISSASAASVSGGSTLSLTVAGNPVTYNLSGDILTIQQGVLPVQDLSNSKVKISPPAGSQLFEKITNTTANTIKINLQVALTSDNNIKQQTTTTILLRGK